jgi:hypothetical protein
MIKAFEQEHDVTLDLCHVQTPFLANLATIEEMMAHPNDGVFPTESEMKMLEGHHQVLGLYCWLSFRRPISFSQAVQARELLDRITRAMTWSLKAVTFESMEGRNGYQRWGAYGLGQEDQQNLPKKFEYEQKTTRSEIKQKPIFNV